MNYRESIPLILSLPATVLLITRKDQLKMDNRQPRGPYGGLRGDGSVGKKKRAVYAPNAAMRSTAGPSHTPTLSTTTTVSPNSNPVSSPVDDHLTPSPDFIRNSNPREEDVIEEEKENEGQKEEGRPIGPTRIYNAYNHQHLAPSTKYFLEPKGRFNYVHNREGMSALVSVLKCRLT